MVSINKMAVLTFRHAKHRPKIVSKKIIIRDI